MQTTTKYWHNYSFTFSQRCSKWTYYMTVSLKRVPFLNKTLFFIVHWNFLKTSSFANTSEVFYILAGVKGSVLSYKVPIRGLDQ